MKGRKRFEVKRKEVMLLTGHKHVIPVKVFELTFAENFKVFLELGTVNDTRFARLSLADLREHLR